MSALMLVTLDRVSTVVCVPEGSTKSIQGHPRLENSDAIEHERCFLPRGITEYAHHMFVLQKGEKPVVAPTDMAYM